MEKLKKAGMALGVILTGLVILALLATAGQDIKEDELTTPELSLSEIKSRALYGVSYDDLFGNNTDFVGEITYYKGRAAHPSYMYGDTYAFQIEVTENPISMDGVKWIWVNHAESRVLEEGDIVDVYGTVKGIKSYTSLRGETIEVPEIDALYIDVVEQAK